MMLTKVKNSPISWKNEKFNFHYIIENNKLIIDLDFFLYKYDLYWKIFNIKLLQEVIVKKGSPVNKSNTILSKDFLIDSPKKKIVIDLDWKNLYTYNWNNINMNLNLLFTIDDAIFFDTEINAKIIKKVENKQVYMNTSNYLFKGIDNFKIINNLIAIWFFNIFVIILFIFFWTLITIKLFVMLSYLLIIIWIFLFIYLCKILLKRYMVFKLNDYDFSKSLEKNYKLSEIVTWKSKVNLSDITIRVVASNTEMWEHITWSWKSRSKKVFTEYVNWFILYEEKIPFIPKNTDISEYIKWSFSFKEMYLYLYPPLIIDNTHWVWVILEIQLIHSKLIDQKINYPTYFMKYEDFLR